MPTMLQWVEAGLLYLVLITTTSSLVEGRRKGVDRLVTGVVTIAFLVATEGAPPTTLVSSRKPVLQYTG